MKGNGNPQYIALVMSLNHLLKWAKEGRDWRTEGFISMGAFRHHKRNYAEMEILDIFRQDKVNNKK